MTRRGSSIGDSLDLLLDTICNTFGGILFIAMLVAILTGAAGRTAQLQPANPQDHQRMLAAQRALTDTSRRIQTLQRAVEQAERLRPATAQLDAVALSEQLAAEQLAAAGMVRQRNNSLSEITASQAQINDVVAEMQRLRESMAEADAALAQAKLELQKEQSLRTRTSRLPRQKTTSRRQIPFFLKEGRLCSFARVDSRGNVIRNSNETRVTTEGGVDYGEPVPGAGITIQPNASNHTELVSRIRAFDPEHHFLAIVVWPDSFAHFDTVRSAVVREGFEYQLVPMARDERIPIGSTTTEQLVQ